MPIVLEPPSAMNLYVRLALLSVMVSGFALIAVVLASMLENYLMKLYQKWLYYLK